MKQPAEPTGLSILDRYILKEFAFNFLLILLSLAVLYLIVDFFQRARMFASNDAGLDSIFLYFIYNIPMILLQMIPVGVLLSSLITFGTLSKNSELVALKASGVSFYRTALPPVLFAVAIGVVMFFIGEFVAPYANQKAKHTIYIDIQNRPQMGEFKRHELWYRGDVGIYNFSFFDPDSAILRGIRINEIDGGMNLVRRIDAVEGHWTDGTWVFYDVMITTFPENDFPRVEILESMVADIPEKPKDFMVVQKEPDEMGFAELRKYIAKIRSDGYDATRYQVDLHGKAAFPFVCIIMAVLGLCFSARSERSGGVAQGIGIGIGVGLSYWLIFAFTMSLGHSGVLPPFLAAWTANILFLLATLFMLTRVRT